MKCRDFYYVICDVEKNEVFSCGASFLDFMEFTRIKPKNILLLKSSFGDGKYMSIAFKLDHQCPLLDHPGPKNRPMIAN